MWPGSDYLKKPSDEAESRSRQTKLRSAMQARKIDLSNITPAKLH
jgi:hypothetical protein